MKALQDFKISEDGFNILSFKKGDDVTLTGEALDVAKKQKWVGTPTKTAAEKKAEEKLLKEVTDAFDQAKIDLDAAQDELAKAETDSDKGAAQTMVDDAQVKFDAADAALQDLQK